MKTNLLTGVVLMAFAATGYAQNTAVINQQGGSHEVSVVQQGQGNTSVVSQSNSKPGNSAVISQSGNGNVATINQGSNAPGGGGQSVSVSQSGHQETHIDQTDSSNNHIIINQTSQLAPADIKPKKQPKRNADKPK